MKKSLKVDERTWDRLFRLKLDNRLKSIDDVINYALEGKKRKRF